MDRITKILEAKGREQQLAGKVRILIQDIIKDGSVLARVLGWSFPAEYVTYNPLSRL